MAIPVDDGVSDFYWSPEGVLMERSTGLPKLDGGGNEIVWVEPAPDPNESLPYDGPTIWAVRAHRSDLPEWTHRTIWIVQDTINDALDLWNDTGAAGMTFQAISLWEPLNLAQHLRWRNGEEGNLAAIIERTPDLEEEA